MNNPVQQAILDRRSIRKYESTPLTDEQLAVLKDAALASPSAVNAQPWHFVFVRNAEVIDQVNEAVREGLIANEKDPARTAMFRKPEYSVFYHAPAVVFICGKKNDENRYGDFDTGIATENICLAAHALGLGTVILGMPRFAFQPIADKGMEKLLRFPEGLEFKIAISVGTPAAGKDAHPIGENKVSYID